MMDNRLSRSCSLIHARSRSLNINCDECYTSPSVYHSIYARRSLLSLSLSLYLLHSRRRGEGEGGGGYEPNRRATCDHERSTRAGRSERTRGERRSGGEGLASAHVGWCSENERPHTRTHAHEQRRGECVGDGDDDEDRLGRTSTRTRQGQAYTHAARKGVPSKQAGTSEARGREWSDVGERVSESA